MAEIGSAFVTIAPSAKGLGKKLDADIGPQLDRSGKAGSKRLGGALSSGLKSALTPAIAILGTAGVGSFLKGSLDEAREAQKVGALTNAVIKSTGGIANVTAKDVDKLSSSLSAKIGVDDEAIAAGQNMLLTFGNVRNEVGKGNDIFNRATVAASDMAAAFGGDAVSNSKMLGKALNDPTEGVSALTRVGVSFTAQQKEQIKTLQASGDTLGAQKVILAELSKQTKGAAEATATSGDKMSVAFGNLQETVGVALVPLVDKFAAKMTSDVIPAMSTFVTGMQDGTGAGGKLVSTLRSIYNNAKPVAETIISVAQAFSGMPGATQKVLLLAGAALLLKNRFGESLPSIQNFDKTTALATAKTVAMRGGALAAGSALAGLASSAGGSSTALGTLATVGAGVTTGFAVAGPWGAAIVGATSILGIFAARSSAASAAQDQLDASGKRVAATLDQQTGALTANTNAVAAKELADNGAFNAAKAMGISLSDVRRAALGNEDAAKRVSVATDAWSTKLIKNGTYTEKQEGQLRTLQKAIGATSGSIADQRRKIDQVNESMGKLDGKKAKVSVELSGLGAASGALAGFMGQLDRANAKKVKLKVGANANGTDFWRGGLTMVGEKGPELINLARGAQVIPNHKIGEVSGSSVSTSGAPAASSQAIPGGTPVIIRVGQREFMAVVQDAVEQSARKR